MVYVTDDGDVVKSTPWGLRRIFGFFTGIIYMIIMFFQTLVNPSMNGSRSQYARDYRPGFGLFHTIAVWFSLIVVYKIITSIIVMCRNPSVRRLGRPNMGNNVDIPFFGGCSSCTR